LTAISLILCCEEGIVGSFGGERLWCAMHLRLDGLSSWLALELFFELFESGILFIELEAKFLKLGG